MKGRQGLLRRTLLIAFLTACCLPVAGVADCGHGQVANYNDVRAIFVRRGVGEANYSFTTYDNGVMVLLGKSRAPVSGGYSGSDGSRLFASMLDALRKADFYSMRLREAPIPYLDGPSETVAVLRCGVVTAIGTLGTREIATEADLRDPQTTRFRALVDSLQGFIIAWPWSKERREPTPTPSPSPHS
jgi:hypothetical protein